MLTSTKKDFSQSRSYGEKSKFLFPSKMLAPRSPLLSSHTKLPAISLMHLDVSCFPAFTPAVPPACNSLPPCLSSQHLLSFHDSTQVFLLCSPLLPAPRKHVICKGRWSLYSWFHFCTLCKLLFDRFI